ncbi:TetR/AcrR family transcriptional regulator [Ottowia pentelensis]|uniref:TetR/AcrR family transcriptional regulator n=1 Tax=Ottowia pentelensis TaxID=511108 RepID=A0ABV6PPP3_9BURK|nr:TetR/AcrR family transcriptional regulator [Ottowia sp.]MBS0413525.1 TetR/AcrR family transcriptional regulator [Pseudomonadota bacterium]HMN56147.1 TetR/AcrR family transcriptional regulator [Ottowia sp.]
MSDLAKSSARRTYRHGDLRRALLDAGVELAREGGPTAVVLREATRRAGVVPNAAYRHFASHQALFDAVRAAALALLAQEIEREVSAATRRERDAGWRARAALRGVGVGYLRFAWQQPGLFRTAFAARPFGLQEFALDDPAPRGASGRDPFELLGDALDAMVAAGLLPPERRPGAEFMAWSAVHGMAFLMIDGPLRALDEPARLALAERQVAMVERGLLADAVA